MKTAMRRGAWCAAAGVALAVAAGPGAARDVDGHAVPDDSRIEPEGTPLRLNGAYVRRSLLREITLFALYTAESVTSFGALAQAGRPRQVTVTILRPEFTAERFREGWREQFAGALAPETRAQLAPQIEQFIGTFETMRRGERISFDFIPGEGLRFRIRGERKATIPGDAFAAALLGVWMGPRSVDTGLRDALLGGFRQ